MPPLADPRFRDEIAAREAIMAATVARVRTTLGNVCSNTLACYRAGKPFMVDRFNCLQRMRTGSLPADAIECLVSKGSLTIVAYDPHLSWYE